MVSISSFLELIFLIEILLFNLMAFNRCCHRKYSPLFVVLGIMIFTILLLPLSLTIRNRFFSDADGDGAFIAAGFIYIIPLYLLYREKISTVFIVMCMIWSYTCSVMALSIQIANFSPAKDFLSIAVLMETLIFAATIFPFYHFILPKFNFILKNIYRFSPQSVKYLGIHSFLYFLVITTINNVFNASESSFGKIGIILLLICFVIISYITIYQMVYGKIHLSKMEHEIKYDPLTGAANRVRLYDDLNDLICQQTSFSLLFMDLDHFKQINDQFGHITGDQYLQHFVRICSEMFAEKATLYRFGGDEFVLLYPGRIAPEEIQLIRQCPQWENNAPCPFHNVSIGCLHCRPPHKSAEEILRKADRKMYQQKLAQRKEMPAKTVQEQLSPDLPPDHKIKE